MTLYVHILQNKEGAVLCSCHVHLPNKFTLAKFRKKEELNITP
jgi:hypothetical protein